MKTKEFPSFWDNSKPGQEEALSLLAQGHPSKFPIGDFPDDLRGIVKNLATAYQVPDCLPAMSALAVISGAVGKSIAAKGGYRDKLTYLNIYVVAGAERGSGKGNTSVLATPIARRSKELAEQWQKEISADRANSGILTKRIQKLESKVSGMDGSYEQSAIELASMQAELERLEKRTFRKPTLWIDNATSEAALLRLQDNNEALFCFSSEAAGALRVALGKYTKSQDSDFDWLLQAYTGDPIRTDRVGRETVELENPCLSLLWMAQPCVLKEIIGNPEIMERGLTARMLLFDSEAKREHEDYPPKPFVKGEEWNSVINRIIDHRLSNEVWEIPCHKHAEAVFRDLHNESVSLEYEDLIAPPGELSRWRENAIKIAGLLAVYEGADIITMQHAVRACRIVQWAGFNYLSMLRGGYKEQKLTELKKLLEILIQSGGQIALGDLHRKHSIKRLAVQTMVSAFPDHLEIIKTPQGSPAGGRPSEILKLKNP